MPGEGDYPRLTWFWCGVRRLSSTPCPHIAPSRSSSSPILFVFLDCFHFDESCSGYKPRRQWPRPHRRLSFARVRAQAPSTIGWAMLALGERDASVVRTRAKSGAIIAALGAICGLERLDPLDQCVPGLLEGGGARGRVRQAPVRLRADPLKAGQDSATALSQSVITRSISGVSLPVKQSQLLLCRAAMSKPFLRNSSRAPG